MLKLGTLFETKNWIELTDELHHILLDWKKIHLGHTHFREVFISVHALPALHPWWVLFTIPDTVCRLIFLRSETCSSSWRPFSLWDFVLKWYLMIIKLAKDPVILHGGSFSHHIATLESPVFNLIFDESSLRRTTWPMVPQICMDIWTDRFTYMTTVTKLWLMIVMNIWIRDAHKSNVTLPGSNYVMPCQSQIHYLICLLVSSCRRIGLP